MALQFAMPATGSTNESETTISVTLYNVTKTYKYKYLPDPSIRHVLAVNKIR